MSSREQHIDHELLAKFFSGESSPKEAFEVGGWAQKHPDLFFELKMVWTDTGKIGNLGREEEVFDVDKGWEKVKIKRARLPRKKERSFRTYYNIAAAILLLLGGALVYKMVIDGDHIQLQELSATDGILKKELPDGSKINLDKGGAIQFPINFGKDERLVRLSGRAHFDVKHNPNRPFIIQTGDVSVKVLGTSFNVDQQKTGTIMVDVISGKVQMSYADQSVILTANMKGVFEPLTAGLTTIDYLDPARDFWRTKTLLFQGTQLSKVIETLNENYDTDLRLANSTIADCQFTATFRDESLDKVLEVLRVALDLNFDHHENYIVINGENCL